LLFAEEDHVVEGLAPQGAGKSFANGIHVRGPHGRLYRPRAHALGNAVELAPNFSSRSRIRNLGVSKAEEM
jgi:hypothetical protein